MLAAEQARQRLCGDEGGTAGGMTVKSRHAGGWSRYVNVCIEGGRQVQERLQVGRQGARQGGDS